MFQKQLQNVEPPPGTGLVKKFGFRVILYQEQTSVEFPANPPQASLRLVHARYTKSERPRTSLPAFVGS